MAKPIRCWPGPSRHLFRTRVEALYVFVHVKVELRAIEHLGAKRKLVNGWRTGFYATRTKYKGTNNRGLAAGPNREKKDERKRKKKERRNEKRKAQEEREIERDMKCVVGREGGTHGNANGGFNAEGSSKREEEEGAIDMKGKREGKATTNLQTSLFYTVVTSKGAAGKGRRCRKSRQDKMCTREKGSEAQTSFWFSDRSKNHHFTAFSHFRITVSLCKKILEV
ncbi:hypothetical protein IW261DRAFT_1427729 [Armillaria novae-zelandiae]|uniref:Uncharacterized protein n=1 Tax=Armillaria novae-zelandiae TaxID=153914 RepID=A0AA39ND12_9AGAR|nr:hypothetical protein IW261DRAFT_1427729 [Armillaria novae-zelandiae]